MSLLSPVEAQDQYPDAWRLIEVEMENTRHGYDVTLLPLVASVVAVDEQPTLQVIAVTDIYIEDDERMVPKEDGQDSLYRMTFTAKLVPF